MSRQPRIALLGEPGSGKTSIGQAFIQPERGRGSGLRLSFAGALKDEVARGLAAWNPTLHAMHLTKMADPVYKDQYRSLLQAWGVFRRTEDPDYWVDAVEQDLQRYLPHEAPLIIDDCRFDNEHEMLLRHGFSFVLLEAGETTRPLSGEQRAHASERDWRLWKPDLVLSYVKGPEKQADRIWKWIEGGSK